MKHFTIKELCKSAKGEKLGIKNEPTAEIIANMEYLCDKLLDPLREALNQPLYVSSCYRCEQLNNWVGGSKTSAHRYAMAADLYVNGNNRIIYDTLLKSGLPYDQVILEYGKPDDPQWVHIGLSRVCNRKQRMYYDGKQYHRLRL